MTRNNTAEDVAFVARMVADQYGEPHGLGKLQHYSFDWRGIYHVHFADPPSYVLRLINDAATEDHFHATAQVLHFLAAQGYPAPRLRMTRDGTSVGRFGDWRMLLATYVEGERVARDPEAMRLQAETAARLHSLPLRNDLRNSRWHPRSILDEVGRVLGAARDRLPAELRGMNEAMLATVDRLRTRLSLPLCLLHGDCWYMNAVRTSPSQVTMID